MTILIFFLFHFQSLETAQISATRPTLHRVCISQFDFFFVQFCFLFNIFVESPPSKTILHPKVPLVKIVQQKALLFYSNVNRCFSNSQALVVHRVTRVLALAVIWIITRIKWTRTTPTTKERSNLTDGMGSPQKTKNVINQILSFLSHFYFWNKNGRNLKIRCYHCVFRNLLFPVWSSYDWVRKPSFSIRQVICSLWGNVFHSLRSVRCFKGECFTAKLVYKLSFTFVDWRFEIKVCAFSVWTNNFAN